MIYDVNTQLSGRRLTLNFSVGPLCSPNKSVVENCRLHTSRSTPCTWNFPYESAIRRTQARGMGSHRYFRTMPCLNGKVPCSYFMESLSRFNRPGVLPDLQKRHRAVCPKFPSLVLHSMWILPSSAQALKFFTSQPWHP